MSGSADLPLFAGKRSAISDPPAKPPRSRRSPVRHSSLGIRHSLLAPIYHLEAVQPILNQAGRAIDHVHDQAAKTCLIHLHLAVGHLAEAVRRLRA